ncbi:MAG: phosphonoacetaldehyde reductase [Alphaproteobacteria bacterium]|nr:phosphonoacetaldehyde reductase [Alphaproteobacteria bacterium]
MDFIGRNSIENLKNLISGRVLFLTQSGIYQLFQNMLKPYLSDKDVTFFDKITENPKKEEIDMALNTFQNTHFDFIVAFGGGSVIDFAKAFRFYSHRMIPLIAIPTTAGTGSQATQFAVVYVENQKTSLDNPAILPDYAIVDSQFVEHAPVYLKACSSIDAYCQAIESYWAKKATLESKEYALQAIRLCRDFIVEAVNTDNAFANEQMAQAAHYAGKAINISRTTASHALSYKITSLYGIPHGHSVALSLVGLFEFNTNTMTNYHELYQALGVSRSDFGTYFHSLMRKIGLEPNLSRLGINNIDEIISGVNLERLNNNPKTLSYQDLKLLFC